MMRINLLLLLAVMASALFLVHTQYASRHLFTELDKAQAEAHRLEMEYDSLQVEKRAQSTPSRIEKIAREQLQMRSPNPGITQYVSGKNTPGQAPAPGAQPSRSGATP